MEEKMRGYKVTAFEIDEAQEMTTITEVEPLEAPQRPSRASEEPSEGKDPFMYYEPAAASGGLPASICTCGVSKRHMRLRALQKWSEKHYQKTGHKPG
jgi:hypothetical protein